MYTDISIATYNRLPVYLKALRNMREQGQEFISSVALAEAARENASVVKSDLSYVISGAGKPKVGYSVEQLISDLESYLGYNNAKDAIIVGVGRLGLALMQYSGFKKYGLNILAGFDINDEVIGKKINGKEILPTGKLAGAVERLNVKLAILCTPQEHAQAMADLLVSSGIRAILNFTAMHLIVPDNVIVKDEDIAAELGMLAMQLKEILKKEDK